MDGSIQALIKSSSTDVVKGKLYVIYERLSNFKWLPGNGDGKAGRAFKHWRLLIEIGFDSFTLEFLENSLISRQGVVILSPFSRSTDSATTYFLCNISIDTNTLYKHIETLFILWTAYSITNNNCQHFVQSFLFRYHMENCLSNRTPHFWRIYDEAYEGVTKTARIASYFSEMGSRSKSNS
ncbi:MAG: hypothetical protein J3R72DRAFT_238538 [Linnemannia gamsii]|nr:MAG: hypothetical protein J3R72DRAFT_238538 [Linnemannia gamsii]